MCQGEVMQGLALSKLSKPVGMMKPNSDNRAGFLKIIPIGITPA